MTFKSSPTLPRVFCSNVRSITNAKHAELLQMSVDYDIIMLTESWLKPHKRSAYNIPNFRLLCVDRANRRAEGVCMNVRTGLAVTVVNESTSETMSASASHNPQKPATIYSVIYHPPNLNKNLCDTTINHITSTVSDLATKYPNANTVIYRDFNDLNTDAITDLLNLPQIVWFPTRKDNTLDLVFTDVPEYSDSPKTTCQTAPNVGNSDHSSITLSSQVHNKPKYVTVKRRVVTEKAKIDITESINNQNWNEVLTETDPNTKASRFQDIMTSIADKHCPVRSVRTPCNKAPITPPLITKLRRAKKTAYKRGCHSWKYFAGHLKIEIQKFQQKQADNNINNVTKGSKQWWRNVKTITGETPSSNQSNYIRLDNEWLTPTSFCTKLNDYYLSIAGDTRVEFPEIRIAENPVCVVNEWDVYKILKSINSNKATHSEDYPSWITKCNAKLLAEPIADIIPSILSTGSFPAIWKLAQVKPLPKKSP